MNEDSFILQMQDKFQGLKPPENDVTEQEKRPVSENMMSLMKQVIKQKETETAVLKLAMQEAEKGDADKAESHMKRFLMMNEKNFLFAKPLFYFRDEGKVSSQNAFLLYGRNDSFPCTLSETEEGHYTFRLPPMASRRNYESFQASSKHVKYTMMLLIDSFEQEQNITMMKKPVIVFEHHVTDRQMVPDPDNLDMKVAIDTMQNIFIPNDCLLDIVLTSYGVTDDEAFTLIHVMERNLYRKWLQDSL